MIANPYVDVNAVSHNGNSILHIPATFGILLSVHILLSRRDININIRNRANLTPIDYALNVSAFKCLLYSNDASGPTKTVEFLVEDCGASCILDDVNTTSLHKACARNRDAYLKVSFLMPYSAMFLNEAKEGCLPLHIASADPDSRVIECIINKNRLLDINARRDSKTLLHIACASGLDKM